MAKRPATKGQKQTRNICVAFVLIFILVGVGANLIISSEFGIFLQTGAPSHDSPLSCVSDGSLQCTTKEGKCTTEQDKCVYPEGHDDCSVLMFKKQLQKSEKKTLRSLYTNETVLQQKKKILEEYCATEMVHLYQAMTDDLATWTIVFEAVLSLALFGLFFSEIVRISHNLAYN